MYTDKDFKTKKAFKEAVAAWKDNGGAYPSLAIYIHQSGRMFDNTSLIHPCSCFVEGPHFPEPHTWHARVKTDAEGRVTEVK